LPNRAVISEAFDIDDEVGTEVSGAPKGLLKRFAILLPIPRKRFYNCVVKKYVRR
jgi:hypothetical protein